MVSCIKVGNALHVIIRLKDLHKIGIFFCAPRASLTTGLHSTHNLPMIMLRKQISLEKSFFTCFS